MVESIRIEMIKKHVHDDQKVLDVGASRGILHQELAKLNRNVIGIDIDAASADARTIIAMDAQQLGDDKNLDNFDLIIAGELIEDLPQPEIHQRCVSGFEERRDANNDNAKQR